MSTDRRDALTILIGRVGEQYSDPDDWRALIRAGRLRRVDSIAVRRADGTTYQRADAVPELLALFDAEDAAVGKPSAPAAPRPVEPRPLPPPPPQTRVTPASVSISEPRPQPAPAGAAPAPSDRRAPPPRPPRPADVRRADPRARPPRPPRRKGSGLSGLLLLAFLGFLAFQLTRCVTGDAGAQNEGVTLYATRETRVRPEAATGNTPLGVVARGDRLRGAWIEAGDGSRWLQLQDGRFEDAFVWGANLTPTAPPPLAEVLDAQRTVRTAGAMLAAPREGAERLSELRVGQTLRVAGRVNDAWLEVTRDGGGVGYVSADRFEAEADAEPETLEVEVVDAPADGD